MPDPSQLNPDAPAPGAPLERRLGLAGATGVGVGAIVGGGILALAGVAFSITGTGAIVAFAINGLIALLTALSFAEMSASFPESGGTYTFAKKVLSVDAAFLVGWVVWFASVVAAVLYALGFAAFAVAGIETLWQAGTGTTPEWLSGRASVTGLAAAATVFYTLSLVRRRAGGGQFATIGKVVVFGVVIAGGAWAIAQQGLGTVAPRILPLFPGGVSGLVQAMGYTFIALQGFDLIAAVGGEVRNPGRNIPRAMVLSLGIALAIYLPLLFIIGTVGVPEGQTVQEAAAANPETMVAAAVENFLGPTGYWLVIVAAVLSMLSALEANLLAASRVVQAMAGDRTMPRRLAQIGRRGTPAAAVAATAGTVLLILALVRDVALAGAAASLVFLVSFALAHWCNILARQRGGASTTPFRLPWFPLIPAIGAVACIGLAVFQGVAVPVAGFVALAWLGLGGVLYFVLFASQAGVVDASTEALDPDLVRLRGRRPLVLAPVANPARAAAFVEVASALAPPGVGRVLLLSVVRSPEGWREGDTPQGVRDAEAILGTVLNTSLTASLTPEVLMTVDRDPWAAIGRVARTYACESLLLGFGTGDDALLGRETEQLMSSIDSDVVVLRASRDWRLAAVRRVLVPVGGRGDQSRLRARLLGSLCRTGAREITFFGVLPTEATEEALERTRLDLERMARDEVATGAVVEVVRGDDPAAEIAQRAARAGLVVLGLRRLGRRRKAFGDFARRLAEQTDRPLLLISRRG